MNVIKRYWFPAAVALLVGVIAFNLYTIYSNRAGSNAQVTQTPEGPGDRHASKQAARTGPGVPRTISLVIAPTNGESGLDTGKVAKALRARGAVQEAQVEVQSQPTMKLTILEPVKLSALSGWLESQGAVVVEQESPLRGNLRLHVSGMT